MIHHQHSVDGQKEELKQKTEINEKLEVISNFDMPLSINIIIPCMIYNISYILCSHLFLKVRHTQMIHISYTIYHISYDISDWVDVDIRWSWETFWQKWTSWWEELRYNWLVFKWCPWCHKFMRGAEVKLIGSPLTFGIQMFFSS